MTAQTNDLWKQVQHCLETPGEFTPDEVSWMLEDVQHAADEAAPTPTVVLPIVHLNGTSKEDLLRQRTELWDALGVVEDKLRQAAPNARDFHLEQGLYEQACAQHARRLEILRRLLAEVETELSGIDEQS